jgi:hypothetical protein
MGRIGCWWAYIMMMLICLMKICHKETVLDAHKDIGLEEETHTKRSILLES